jgi:hypothetical protein
MSGGVSDPAYRAAIPANLLIDGVGRTLSIATDFDLNDQRNFDKKVPVRST